MTRTRPDIPAPGTPEAKARRIPRQDISKLSDDQRRRRELVMRFGEAAYGSRWQTPMADALGRLRGQDTAPVQIAAWVSGARPVPPHVIEELEVLAIDVAAELQRRAERLHAWPAEPPSTASTTEELLAGFPPDEPGSAEELGLHDDD